MVKDSLPSSSSNTNADEDKLSWRNVDVIDMIQLVVSDEDEEVCEDEEEPHHHLEQRCRSADRTTGEDSDRGPSEAQVY